MPELDEHNALQKHDKITFIKLDLGTWNLGNVVVHPTAGQKKKKPLKL